MSFQKPSNSGWATKRDMLNHIQSVHIRAHQLPPADWLHSMNHWVCKRCWTLLKIGNSCPSRQCLRDVPMSLDPVNPLSAPPAATDRQQPIPLWPRTWMVLPPWTGHNSRRRYHSTLQCSDMYPKVPGGRLPQLLAPSFKESPRHQPGNRSTATSLGRGSSSHIPGGQVASTNATLPGKQGIGPPW